MKHYIDKLLHILWSIIEFVLLLLIWPTINLLSEGIANRFNVAVNDALEVIVGILFCLIGLYTICEIRPIFEKDKIPKICLIVFGWLGPISSIIVGISLIM